MNPKILIGGGIGCIILAVLIAKLIQYAKSQKSQSNKNFDEILEECFGVQTYASVLSITEVRDWINARDDLLTETSKAAVLKVNEKALKTIGKDLDLGDFADNMIVIAIVNENDKEIKASTLIKYGNLDNKLNEMLENGDGVLVIER